MVFIYVDMYILFLLHSSYKVPDGAKKSIESGDLENKLHLQLHKQRTNLYVNENDSNCSSPRSGTASPTHNFQMTEIESEMLKVLDEYEQKLEVELKAGNINNIEEMNFDVDTLVAFHDDNDDDDDDELVEG